MLQIIIFSFNRAMQLDTLLRSIYNYFEYKDYRIDVLYNCSDDEFEKGYMLLKNNYPEVSFVKESMVRDSFGIKEASSFYNLKKIVKHKKMRIIKTNFRSLLRAMLHKTKGYTMFLTDDSAFYSSINLTDDIFDWIGNKPECRSFSLRLGLGVNQTEPKTVDGDYVFWNFYSSKEKKNWSYQFSVDGHIYSNEVMRNLADKIFFTNPSFFESMVCNYVREKNMLGEGRCFLKSKLLSFPINMVQKVANNESLNASLETLNEKFLDGYTFGYNIPEKIEEFQQYPSFLILTKGDDDNIKLECQ
ncbi:hypothetical protein NXY00_05435 [Bacteroides sp. BFG-551]|nr:hypothetical protein [Bacteroides sp. BFG-551]